MIILGIDPGTATTGFAVLEVDGSDKKLLDCGVITTDKTLAMPQRLQILYTDLREIVAKYKPDCMSVEKLFFTNNITTGISVAQARGVVLLISAEAGLELGEYTPLQIKQAVTGYGQAKKPQVQQMVKTILGLKAIPRPDDAADAVAIALTHAATLGRAKPAAG